MGSILPCRACSSQPGPKTKNLQHLKGKNRLRFRCCSYVFLKLPRVSGERGKKKKYVETTSLTKQLDVRVSERNLEIRAYCLHQSWQSVEKYLHTDVTASNTHTHTHCCTALTHFKHKQQAFSIIHTYTHFLCHT